jgi:hypothetical protein
MRVAAPALWGEPKDQALHDAVAGRGTPNIVLSNTDRLFRSCFVLGRRLGTAVFPGREILLLRNGHSLMAESGQLKAS